MQVDAGKSVALLGRSGSGKSTLLSLLAGLDDIDGGAIDIGATRISSIAEPARTRFRRRHIGFVYQQFNVLPTLSVLDNVLLMLDLNGVTGLTARERAHQWLAAVGLATAADRMPDTLSGGEQQRVGIARALVHQPGLVLADEPTGNLDADTASLIAALLSDLVEQAGTTLIMATHSASLAAGCDRQLALGAKPSEH